MADFNQAKKWYEEGKEFLINGQKEFSGDSKAFMNANFELVEEKKTLSDKIEYTHEIGYAICVKEVKQFLKEFDGLIHIAFDGVQIIVGDSMEDKVLKKIYKKVFGERLI